MNLGYNCVHCVCHECHFKNISSDLPSRSLRRSSKRVSINNQEPTNDVIRKCNHSVLEKFSDLSYFTKTFMKKIDDERYPLPKKCSKCNRFLVLKS